MIRLKEPGVLYSYGDIPFEDTTVDDLLSSDFGIFPAAGEDHVVTISYSVLETWGGERTFSASRSPIYRPPFWIEENKSQFVLETDRTSSLSIGRLMRLGPDAIYIQDSTYDSDTDQTTVTFFPSTRAEIGSRAPGNDALCVITDRPATYSVNGLMVEEVTGETNAQGFLFPLDDSQQGGDGTNTVPWDPVSAGSNKIEFHGNITRYAIPGHLIEIGGYPYIIIAAGMSENGLKTVVMTSSTFHTGHSMAEDVVRLSIRPIYPPSHRDLLGISPFFEQEGWEVIRYGETDKDGNELPGRTLSLGAHYDIEPADGAISLSYPLEKALQPDHKIHWHHTRADILAPQFDPNSLSYRFPRIYAQYRYNCIPSEQNGILGASVHASYTFHHPDVFHCRITTLKEHSVKVADALLSQMGQAQGGQGAIFSQGAEFDTTEAGHKSICLLYTSDAADE